MTGYLLGALALAGGLLLPAVAIALLAERDASSPSLVRAATVGLAGGLSVWTIAAVVLVRAGGLTPTGVWAVVGGLALVSTVVVVRLAPRAWRGGDREGVGRGLVVAGLAVALAAGPAVALVVARRDTLLGSTPWYYWQLTRETVLARGVPHWSLEWATRLPFLDDYPGFTAGSALLAVATRHPGTLVAAQLVRVLAAVATVGAGYLLARVLGARRIASAMAAIVIASGTTFATKLASFRPESAGYALMLLIPALAVLWLRRREPVTLVVLAAASLALGETHGVDWVFTIAWVVGLAVAALVAAGRGRRRTVGWSVVGLAAALGGTWLLGNLLLGGGLSGAEKLGRLPSVGADGDPTWAFRELTVGVTTVGSPPSMAALARSSLRLGFAGLGWGWWALAAGLALAGVIALVVRGGEDRRAAVRFLISVVVALAVVLAFSWFLAASYSTDVPRRTGFARVLPLAFVFVPIAGALAVSALGRTHRALAAVIAVVVALGVGIPAARWTHSLDVQQPATATLGQLRNLDLPAGSLVLTNSYSEGYVPVVTGARGVVDGRAPYTERGVLERVNGVLRSSIDFFAHPAPPDGAAPPLPVDGITHVLVGTGPWSLGAGSQFPTDVAALTHRPDLRLIRSGDGYALYEVVR